LQLKEFENFDVVDDTGMRDENNIMAQTPNAIYTKSDRRQNR
jgi:outer membrane protein